MIAESSSSWMCTIKIIRHQQIMERSNLVRHDDFIHIVRDKFWLPSAWSIDVCVQILHYFRKTLKLWQRLDRSPQMWCMDNRPHLLSLLVQIGYCNSSGKDGVIWMLSGQVCSCFSRKRIEFGCFHSVVQSFDTFESDSGCKSIIGCDQIP